MAQHEEEMGREETELTPEAIKAIEEGRADHAAGRTYTLEQVKSGLTLEVDSNAQ